MIPFFTLIQQRNQEIEGVRSNLPQTLQSLLRSMKMKPTATKFTHMGDIEISPSNIRRSLLV